MTVGMLREMMKHEKDETLLYVLVHTVITPSESDKELDCGVTEVICKLLPTSIAKTQEGLVLLLDPTEVQVV